MRLQSGCVGHSPSQTRKAPPFPAKPWRPQRLRPAARRHSKAALDVGLGGTISNCFRDSRSIVADKRGKCNHFFAPIFPDAPNRPKILLDKAGTTGPGRRGSPWTPARSRSWDNREETIRRGAAEALRGKRRNGRTGGFPGCGGTGGRSFRGRTSSGAAPPARAAGRRTGRGHRRR